MPDTAQTALPDAFADTGVALLSRSGTAPVRFQVLGERSSGTNLAKRLMGRNSALAPSEVLGWKHGFAHALAIPADLAVIGVVRNAADWARSMHAKPWHTTPAMQSLPFPEFIRAPWDTIVDRPRYFAGSAEAGLVGAPLQLDRDPATGRGFTNLFALRRAKLASLLSHANRQCTFVLLRAEQVQADPEGTVDTILSLLEQPARQAGFRPVHKRLGAKFLAAVEGRPETPAGVGAADMAFLRDQLDLTTEARLGYRY